MNFILTDECYKCRGGINTDVPMPLETLTCAKNDTAAFQVLCDNDGNRCILNPGTSPALNYEMNLPRYRICVKSDFLSEVYAEGYMKDENGIPRAELLYTSEQKYEGGLYAPAYIRLKIPATAVAGDYRTDVCIYRSVGAHDETLVSTLHITLQVADYIMPDPKDYRLHLDLWQHNSNIARTYGVELWSDEHFKQIEKVLVSLARLGQKSVTVMAGDCPWRGWGCYLLKDYPATLFEYAMTYIQKNDDGTYQYDFSPMRRYIKLCAACGILGDVTVYGLMGIWTNMPMFNGVTLSDYPENLLIRYFDCTDGCYKYMSQAEDIKNYILALFSFFREINVFDKVRIGADEPSDIKAYTANYNLLKSIAPDIKFKMALDKSDAILQFAPITADIAASFPCSCNHGELLRKQKAAGNRVLWYVCNIPDKPNTVLHSRLIETLALGAIGYLLGFDGFLRWAYTCWTDNPLADIRYNNTALPAGDVNFVYPSKNGELLYSLRYYALEKTIRDYELLQRLSDKGQSRQAREIIRLFVKNTDPSTYMKDDIHTNDNIYSTDYSDYQNFYTQLLKTLIRSK